MTVKASPEGRALLLAKLDLALMLAGQLTTVVSKQFPAAAGLSPAAVCAGLSTDELVALGDAAAGELKAVAFNLAPERAMDGLERDLNTDATSLSAAADLMGRLAPKR